MTFNISFVGKIAMAEEWELFQVTVELGKN